MARIAAILKALARALRRDQKTLESVVGNNFFIVTAFFLQKAGVFIYLILGLVLLFPLSTDPLRKIPRSRLEMWPLDAGERRLLRVLSPWVNPITWVMAGLAVWAARGKLTLGLWGLIAGVAAVGFAISEVPAPAHGLLRRVPNLPGMLNHLVRKNLREMFSTLDLYCALILSASALVYRAAGLNLPREAFVAMSVLVVLALSSYAQCLFGLDGAGGLGRYRLLPVPGWRILLAKDAAFLMVMLVLALPLAVIPAMAAALVALAMGHAPSVETPRPQTRWRFSSGGSLLFGFAQAIAMGVAASGVAYSAWFFLACVVAWAGSVWWYGRELERWFE